MVSSAMLARGAYGVMRSKYGPVLKAAPYVAKAGKYLIQRSMKSYMSKRNSKKSITFDGVTQQRDDKVSYRKRRMPKKKRRQWRKFVKKCEAVEIKGRGLQIAKYNQNGVNSIPVPALGQVYNACHLYGAAVTSQGEPGARDLKLLSNDVLTIGEAWIKRIGGDVNQTLGFTKNKTEIRMQSAQLDLYLKNTSSVVLLFEIYHLWYNRTTNAPSFAEGAFETFNNEQIKQEWDGSNLTNMTQCNLNSFNATLFDENQLISYLGATVRSVRQVYIGAGEIHHMQIRDPKNYNIDLNKYQNLEGQNVTGYVDPKLTETYLIVVKNIDSSTAGSFTYNACRTYRYTVEGVKTTAAGLKSIN